MLDAVVYAPPAGDDAVAVPQPAVTTASRHATSPLDRKFICASWVRATEKLIMS